MSEFTLFNMYLDTSTLPPYGSFPLDIASLEKAMASYALKAPSTSTPTSGSVANQALAVTSGSKVPGSDLPGIVEQAIPQLSTAAQSTRETGARLKSWMVAVHNEHDNIVRRIVWTCQNSARTGNSKSLAVSKAFSRL